MAGLGWLIQQLRRVISRDVDSECMTLEKALSYAPVWHAVSKISGHVAYLPTNLHQETTKDGKTTNLKVTEHLGYRLLRERPNGYQTPMQFKRQSMVHALMMGNGFAYIKRNRMMSELLPLMPDRTKAMMISGEKVYMHKPDRDDRLTLEEDIQQAMKDSRESGKMEVIALRDNEVFHIPGLSYDGISGLSLITLAARTWELGVGAENVERSRQRKGYAGGLMLEAPDGSFTKQKDAEEFLKWFRENHEGTENVGKTGLLTRGIKANVLQLSASDSQFLEQRKFQRQDTALFFMLEHILGDDSSVSYNSLEQKNLAYLQNCLATWLKTWEEEAELKLLTEKERQNGFYFKFNDGALLRTDKQTTSTIIATLRSSQVISANEARGWLDMNPYDGGDSYDNPNTTSSKQPAGAAAPQPTASYRDGIVRNRIAQLLKTEGTQAVTACDAENFVDKIEKLYSRWQKTWAADIGEESAAVHCEEAKAELLECAGRASDKEELKRLVSELVATWPEKVAAIESGLCDAV